MCTLLKNTRSSGRLTVPGAFLNVNTIEVGRFCTNYNCIYSLGLHLIMRYLSYVDCIGVSVASEESPQRRIWSQTAAITTYMHY